ncbi:MAG: CpsD/CapB family tyrosine-protein kinase [Lachnospiraceae bacterium]|nr:CpsD/CapB family tyrosine-protein kinase [Lachnospiraceae bacterium]
MSKLFQIEKIQAKTEESIRRLSVNISNSYPEAKIILVSSVAGKEGKSFISLHLSRVLGGRGSKTLYINGDMRSNPSAEKGLSDYMEGKEKQEQIIYETDAKNLSVIPNGTERVIIDEVVMKHLLKDLRSAYDYIVIDTPSLGEVADGMMIGKFCDGVLLVIEPEIVPEKKLRSVKEELERSGCKILGVVLNKEL